MDERQMEEKEDLEELRHKKGGFGKGFVTGVIVCAVVCAVVIMFGSPAGVYLSNQKLLDRKTVRKLEQISKDIQENYYEDVDVEELREGLFAGLFEHLDTYSQYYSKEEFQSLYENSVSGTYYGIGASLQQDEETQVVSIVHVYEGSPAEEAGLKEADIIVSADDYVGTEMELTEFVSHIRGEENTTVHLVILRNGEQMEFDIARKNLSLPTVSSEMFEGKTGYIAVSEFTDATPEQFAEAIETLTGEGMTSLIVDLRSNPGGMLNAVCEMLDQCLPEGLLVYMEDREGHREEYRSTDEHSLDLPMVVLVDEHSASASEIFAGAIKDRKAGVILGTTTYGKGVVQTIHQYKDGSAFKITQYRYFTPNGICIQDIGITPDIELDYEFLGGKDDTYSYEYDNQIRKALEVLHTEQ